LVSTVLVLVVSIFLGSEAGCVAGAVGAVAAGLTSSFLVVVDVDGTAGVIFAGCSVLSVLVAGACTVGSCAIAINPVSISALKNNFFMIYVL